MAEVTYQIRKSTAVPTTPTTPNTFFYVAPTGNTTDVELYVSDKTGNAVRRIINETDVKALIQQATLAGSATAKYMVVADINARNGLTDKTAPVFVKNASADPTVKAGGAFYIWDTIGNEWVKTAETESMDVVLKWADITGKPTSTVTDIDNAVSLRHNHSNKTQLDLIGATADGKITYNGALVAPTLNDAW